MQSAGERKLPHGDYWVPSFNMLNALKIAQPLGLLNEIHNAYRSLPTSEEAPISTVSYYTIGGKSITHCVTNPAYLNPYAERFVDTSLRYLLKEGNSRNMEIKHSDYPSNVLRRYQKEKKHSRIRRA